jgi:nucleotide-binding universal stress UspA family protein
MAGLDPHRPAPPIDALVQAATFAGPAIHLIRPAIAVTSPSWHIPAESPGEQPLKFAGDDELAQHAREAVEEAVAAAAKEIGAEKEVHVTVSAINGFPAEALINASADADLVVVGMRGGGGFPHLHLGGVSSQVAHHAKCPRGRGSARPAML